MKKIIISILLTLTLLLSTTSIALAAPFDLTYSTDSTKNYTFNQFIDSPTVFDFVAANLAGYEIEGVDGNKYNAQEINNRTMLGMTFVQAVASIQATAAVVTAEGSLLQADINAAQALITALPNGADKTALQDRLNIVIASMPVVPPAPSVIRDDVANTVSGMTAAMEYNLDGGGYVAYVAATFNAIDFSGNHSLLVRVAAEGINPPSLDTTLTFTTNPGPPVTNNDVTDQVFGMTMAMEYNYDGTGYVMYDQFDIAFASLNFHGEHTLLVRYAAVGVIPAGPVTTLIFTTAPGPNVTNDDVANTVTGMSTTMEYNLDGAGYAAYVAATFNALNLSGNHTLLVRYAADGFMGYPPSLDTTLTFTTNPGPDVTNDDIANTVTGMTTAMEYNLDGAGYVAYDAIIFAAIDLSGSHTLLVRVASDGINPAGPAATLIFTTNPVAPAAPPVTNDDDVNTVTGMEIGMEYNYDGTGYVMYTQTNFDWANLEYDGFVGNHTLLVRYAAVGGTPASLVTTLTFTTNPARPGPPLTIDDDANTVIGEMTIEMEYNYDGTGYVTYDNMDTTAWDSLDFTGNHTLLVRYAEDFMNGWPASLDTTLIFTTNPATLSSIAITTTAAKTTYAVGDVLNLTGLVVTGTYSDSSAAVVPVTAGNITGFNSTAPVVGQTLTISVNGKTTTFNINILKVTLNKTTTSMLLGMSDTLIATVLPIDAPNKDVIWTVASGSNSATVNNGLVTGINLGIATVTATTVDGSIKAQCFVTVANEASILNNFNLGTITYMPGLITQFGDAIGLNLPVYSRMNATQQLQIQQLMIDTPFTTLADIKNTFDQALVAITLDEIHYATVNTMGAALESVSIVMDLNLTSYDSLSLAEKEIVHGKLLIPVWFGTYYTSAAEIQTALDLAVSNAPEAVTALAVINDASVETLSNALVNNAVLLGLSLDNYILYIDQTTINTALEAQVFTNSYDLQIAIEMILYDLTSLYIEPFNMAGMDTIGTVIADNAAALGLDLTIYDLLSPAEQEIVHGYLVAKPYFVSGYYSLAALHAAFNEAVANAPAAEIALGAINAATVDAIDEALVNNAVLLGIDMTGYDSATMNAILEAQDFTNTYDLQLAIYGW